MAMHNEIDAARSVLVTEATGYIGGKLAPRLLEDGHRVRVFARNPDRLTGRVWHDRVDVVRGDALDPATLGAALDGVDCACYLIHSMAGGAVFRQRNKIPPGRRERREPDASYFGLWGTRRSPSPRIWNPGKKPGMRRGRAESPDRVPGSGGGSRQGFVFVAKSGSLRPEIWASGAYALARF